MGPGSKNVSEEPSWLHPCISCIRDAGVSRCHVTPRVLASKPRPCAVAIYSAGMLWGQQTASPPSSPHRAAPAHPSAGKVTARSGELAVLLRRRCVTQPLRTLQMVNEICLSVQKHVDILSACSGREAEADILCAEEAIRNANLSISVSPPRGETPSTRPASAGDRSGLLIS